MIRDMAMSLQPTLYTSRVAEAAIEKTKMNAMLPAFFSQSISEYYEIIFPGQRLQLHLFEPRYKLMMKRLGGELHVFVHLFICIYMGKTNCGIAGVGVFQECLTFPVVICCRLCFVFVC
jgi:hypothetical protein